MTRPLHSILAVFVGAVAFVGGFPSVGAAQDPDSLTLKERESLEWTPTLDYTLEGDTTDGDTDKDAPYVPTSQETVERMLEVAGVSEGDVVYDLGSGDGRIPITAAKKYGARAVGIEIDPELVTKARTKAEAAGVSDQVEFRQGDLFEADLSEATVVALYLWPEMNKKLRPKLLRELSPGDRVVSHDFWMGEWEPDRIVKEGVDTIYLWRIPEEIPKELLQAPEDGR